MGGKKYKMPSNKYFLKKKRTSDPRKDPVWVYLEKEMRANIDKKPYNKKVGSWLAFLKELKHFYRCKPTLIKPMMKEEEDVLNNNSNIFNSGNIRTGKATKKKLLKEIGPRWFTEFSTAQREVLQGLSRDIHRDSILCIPTHVRQSLINLGIERKLSTSVLMKAVSTSVSDPGLFMWRLYEDIYKVSPCVLKKKYDIDAMIIMSSLVFVDLEECLQELESRTTYKKKTRNVVPKKKKTSLAPDVRYGEYLQKSYVKMCSNHRSAGPKPRPKPKPLGTKCRFRSEESYTALRLAPDFLEKRRKMNIQEMPKERICNYRFWEPPINLRSTDPKQAAYVEKLKVMKKRANVKYKTPFDNLTYKIAGVSLIGDTPQYILSNNVALPTGYTMINAGIVKSENGDRYTNVNGHWKTANYVKQACKPDCDCLEKWEQQAIEYTKKSKCKCKHSYDFYGTGKSKERYFYPPTRHGPYWIDNAKVFRLNPLEDFVQSCVNNAVRSDSVTPNLSNPSIPLATISKKKLLKALLADISDTALIIPHLPQAHLLNNLLEWVRKRVRGNLTPKQNNKHKLKSQRRWLQLKHLDFRSHCYYIPFTLKQLKHMTFNHRGQINKLLEILLKDFVARNRKKQVEQARLMWPTTKYDQHPHKAFLETYFTYMPSRIKDSYLVNPYNSASTAKSRAKTCPIVV